MFILASFRLKFNWHESKVFKTFSVGKIYYNVINFFKLFQAFQKAQITGTNQDFIIRCRYFSCCYLFISLWNFSNMSFPYLSGDSLMFFWGFFCYVGP